MSNGSIRVESKNKYVIDVNDKLDTIEFDLTEVGLPARLIETYDELQNIISKFERTKNELLKREDSQINEHVTQNEFDLIKLTEEYYKESRNSLDKFLGKGACQKIFGDINYYEMFDDLFEKLAPHFNKMGLNVKTMQKQLVKKYSTQNDNILR